MSLNLFPCKNMIRSDPIRSHPIFFTNTQKPEKTRDPEIQIISENHPSLISLFGNHKMQHGFDSTPMKTGFSSPVAPLRCLLQLLKHLLVRAYTPRRAEEHATSHRWRPQRALLVVKVEFPEVGEFSQQSVRYGFRNELHVCRRFLGQ